MQSYYHAQSFELNSNKYIAIKYPRGKEIFNRGEEIKVEWEFLNVDKIRIEVLEDSTNSWKTVASSISASIKSYKIKIDQLNSNKFKIKISDLIDSSIVEISTPFLLG